MIRCAPGQASKKNHDATGTCYDRDRLLAMARRLAIPGASSMSPRKLGRVVKRALQRRNLTDIRSGNAVRPPKPTDWIANEFKWLNSLDIAAVMKQYERGYPDFRFVGVFPRDFAKLRDERGQCVVEDMCNFDVTRLLDSRVTRVGMVINLDEHGQRGSHWVAVFMEASRLRTGVYYYDSTADPPHKDILVFMQDMRNRMAKHLRRARVEMMYNKRKRQRQNTECGVFCLAFLAIMVETKLMFDEVCSMIPFDADVHMLRDVFFLSDKQSHGEA